MLIPDEKMELENVVKHASVVANDLAKKGNLVHSGCVNAAIQAIRYLVERVNLAEKGPDDESGTHVGNSV